MAFKINGEDWQPKTAYEHTIKIMQKINELLQENNVTDQDGNIVQLKQSYGNALYLLSLGDGQSFADLDAELSAAINSFNIELCDDLQLQNLLPIAAMTRNPGSYSTLKLKVTASDEGMCVIPAGTKAPYENVNFVVPTEVVISAGNYQIIETVCDTLGPVAVLAGEVTAFENEVPNLESVENLESSVPGVAAESTASLRQRLIVGDTIRYSLNGCKNALEELTGVAYARVYFNYNTTQTITLPGGVVLQPRTAYIVVLGSSEDIANVYTEYMSAPTQNSPIAQGAYSTLKVAITAKAAGNAVLPDNTSVSYNGHDFVIDEGKTIEAGTTEEIEFVCSEWGPFEVPSYAITALDQEIENVESVINSDPAIPGRYDPRHQQDWVSNSGQNVAIYYDDATEENVFVKVWLKKDAESGEQVENQIKRDLILSSAAWTIGETVTQLLTSAPFINCTYTEVAYTEVSRDGINWSSVLEIGCNTIPRISDGTISIEQLGE